MPVDPRFLSRLLSASMWSFMRVALAVVSIVLVGKAGSVLAQDRSQVFQNEWAGKDASGRAVRFVRWPIGSRDQVVELQIPTEYIEFAGGCGGFSPGAVDPNCRQPFSVTAPLLRVMLPDFTPVPRRPLTRDEQNQVLNIKVDSVFFGRDKTVSEVLQIMAHVALGGFEMQEGAFLRIHPWDQSLLVHKKSQYGLSKIGLRHDMSPGVASSLKDYLYLPTPTSRLDVNKCENFEPPKAWRAPPSDIHLCRDWVEATDFMLCMDEAAPEPTSLTPNFVPNCQQWFGNESLSAVITLRYERQWNPNWQKIKSDAQDFLNKFNKGSK